MTIDLSEDMDGLYYVDIGDWIIRIFVFISYIMVVHNFKYILDVNYLNKLHTVNQHEPFIGAAVVGLIVGSPVVDSGSECVGVVVVDGLDGLVGLVVPAVAHA